MGRLPSFLLFISIFFNLLILIVPLDQSGIHTITVVSIICVFAAIMLIRKQRQDEKFEQTKQESVIMDQSEVEQEQEKFLQILRHQRHDWLNHFQVLLGYLKLQRYDVCEEYIKKVTDNTNNDSRIAQLGFKPLVTYLLSFNVIHKLLSLEVELPSLVDLKRYSKKDQETIYELIKGLLELYLHHTQDADGEPSTIVLLIQELEDSLYLSLEFEGELNETESLQAIYALVDKFKNEEGFFVEGLHNNRESIMEFYIPIGG